MKTGKVSENILKRSVLKQCRNTHPAVIQGAESGSDCALILAAEKSAVSCSVHPQILNSVKKVRFALEHAVNNLACSGGSAAAVLLTVLLPEEAEEAQLKSIMKEAAAVCEELGIQIAGGHTEVTGAVKLPLLTVTAVGVAENKPVRVQDAQPGMDLLVVGTIGREGTALLADRYGEELKKRFPLDFVERAKEMGESICISRMAQLAREYGAAALHDASQGGIFGALWEFCEGAKTGMLADLRKIPVRQETIEICEYFGYNPYCLLSGGALLIAAVDGRQVELGLQQHGIQSAVIGKLTDSNDRLLLNGEERRFLERPAQDEIWRGRGDAELERKKMSWQI